MLGAADVLPNTYLIGAPKCGTTALASFLAAHPQGFLGYPKEPSYWSSDLAQSGSVARVTTEAAYRQIYANAGRALAIVDASTRYLYSQDAVARITAAVPRARFIVMLRDPVEMAQAYHMEKVFNLSEDVTDFEAAWRLQAARATGAQVPPACVEPKELQYAAVAALGTQLERAQANIPAGQLLVLFHDDLVADPRAFWLKVQDFLGLKDDGRVDFPVVGGAHFNRFPRLARIYQAPGPLLGPVVRRGKKLLRTRAGARLLGGVKALLVSRRKRAPVSAAFRTELRAVFDPEVKKLEVLTGRDLSQWRGDTT